MKALFITFEGIEGSGKTTQAKKAEDYLKKLGYPVLRTYEPGATRVGEYIRRILLEKNDDPNSLHPIVELLLFSADRTQHLQEVVLPALEQGTTVICDRYIDSTTAYQGGGRGIDFELVNQIHKIATLCIYPTRTYLLDLPVEVGLQRISRRGNILDRLETENIEFHQRIRDCFLRIANQYPQRVMIVDAMKSEEEIALIIQNDIRDLCQKH